MGDAFRSFEAPRRRRHGLVAIAVLAAFAAGLAMAWWGLTRWGPRAPAAAVPVLRPAPALPRAPTPSPVAADPAALTTREDLVAARLATIEARTAIVSADAQAASGEAGRAEALLLAAAARRAVEAGAGLGPLEAPLRARFAGMEPRATQLVIAAAHQPMTADALRAAFEALVPDLVAGGGWWHTIGQSVGSLVVIHRAGEPSPVPADRIARARGLLAEGRMEVAAAEVAQLPGASAAAAWLLAARRYADTQRALDRLETAAILGVAAPSVPQPVQ